MFLGSEISGSCATFKQTIYHFWSRVTADHWLAFNHPLGAWIWVTVSNRWSLIGFRSPSGCNEYVLRIGHHWSHPINFLFTTGLSSLPACTSLLHYNVRPHAGHIGTQVARVIVSESEERICEKVQRRRENRKKPQNPTPLQNIQEGSEWLPPLIRDGFVGYIEE